MRESEISSENQIRPGKIGVSGLSDWLVFLSGP